MAGRPGDLAVLTADATWDRVAAQPSAVDEMESPPPSRCSPVGMLADGRLIQLSTSSVDERMSLDVLITTP